jgi:hypothetical protein
LQVRAVEASATVLDRDDVVGDLSRDRAAGPPQPAPWFLTTYLGGQGWPPTGVVAGCCRPGRPRGPPAAGVGLASRATRDGDTAIGTVGAEE